ncbi:hypothetical protein PROFUN_13651 [Planoprotostelium fungivorum]|uniref:Alkaline ceramidase 3-like n=1 Tax=Planoprotostelium fungivorum TaxID=1890364 RepID=A0A2P6N3G2_9EUKA|nr:hypothetical protein PROFUN_13651 [Planoprotostelium fungivorum]
MKYFEDHPTGVWNATATLNWCEEDYVVTPYIAEFVNTLTNLWAVTAAIYIYDVYKYKYDTRYLFLWISGCIVATGSWFFHMTLRWEWQTAASFLFLNIELTPKSASREEQKRNALFVAVPLILLTSVISIVYIQINIAIFHQVAYAAMVLSSVVRTIILHRRYYHKFIQPHLSTEGDITDVQKRRTFAEMRKLQIIGAVMFLTAFILWNVDNVFCLELRKARRDMGRLGFLLQLHGWWHIGTGIGTVYMAAATQMLSLLLRDEKETYRFSWTLFIPRPIVYQNKGQKRL